MPSASRPGLRSLIYRSRATSRLDAPALDALVQGARQHNHRVGVTGSMLYRDGAFLQWLEGPDEIVEGLFDRISRDPRHTGIEVLSDHHSSRRLFHDWDMRLVTDTTEQGFRVLQNTTAVSALDRRFARRAALELAQGDAERTRSALLGLAHNLDAQICLCEQVTDAYAELWAEDDCDDSDLAIGLAMLATTLRRVQRFGEAALGFGGGRQRWLIAPLPGETHILGATLASTLLSEAGADVCCVFPQDDMELLGQLHRQACDAVVLVSSGVFRREHRLAALGTLCAGIRSGSRPPPRVLVYGRLAEDDLDGLACDAGCSSALQLGRALAALACSGQAQR
jgi:hypothetical protein